MPTPPPLPISRAGLLEWMTQAVVADGVISPEEKDLLSRTAARQRIAPEHLEAMITAARSGSNGPSSVITWCSERVPSCT